MRDTGFRINVSEYSQKLALVKENLQAQYFWPDLLEYLRKSLNRCVKTEHERDAGLIKRNQQVQYGNRINYIPSIHWRDGDRLNVASDGTHWLNVGGTWYKANVWKMPSHVWGIYQELLAERNRRMETSRADFVQNRAQARFLYKKSWVQVGESLGLEVRSSEKVQKSLTRRIPAKDPAKGYPQQRGGGTIISIAIYNPFATKPTPYFNGDGASVLSDAQAEQRKPFEDAVKRKLNRAIFAILKEHGGE